MASILLYPNGAGSETNITSVYGAATHHEAVDEPAANDNIDYIYCGGTSYLRDLFALPDMPVIGCVITSVEIFFRIWQSVGNVSQAKAKPSIRSGGTTVDGTEVYTGDTAGVWTSHSQVFTVNPVTSVAWTLDEINALEIGVALNANAPSTWLAACTQVYIKVNYYIVGTADAITRVTSVARYYNREARMLRMSVGLGGLATIPMLASEGFKPTPTEGQTGAAPSLETIKDIIKAFDKIIDTPPPVIVTPTGPANNKDGEDVIVSPPNPLPPYQYPDSDAEEVAPPLPGYAFPDSDAEVGLSVPDSIYHNPADAERVAAPKLPSLPPLPGFNSSDGESTGNNGGNSGSPLNGGRGGYLWDF